MATSTAPGRALRVLRQLADLTLEQTATEAGTSPAHLSRVETGQVRATPAWIGRVSAVIASHLRDAA